MNRSQRRTPTHTVALSCVAWIVLSTPGCEVMVDPKVPSGSPFGLDQLVKTDTDATLELFVAAQHHHIAQLVRKLYLRNPRELHKTAGMTIERRMQQVLEPDAAPPGLGALSGVEQLRRALDPTYRDDRVFAFACGLRAMFDDSFDGKRELYIPDHLDPQRLYHCARNFELAAWKITHDRGPDGHVLLLTNSMDDDAPMNLSYERLFGEMIALQDMAASIVADRTNRTIRFVSQALVFLPV